MIMSSFLVRNIATHHFCEFQNKHSKENKLRGLSPRANYTETERPPLDGEVSAKFC
jgi:hypothetical protein